MAQAKYVETSANGLFSGVYFMGRWVSKVIANQNVMYTTNLGAALLLMTKSTDHLNLKFLNTIPNARFQPEIAIFIDDQSELRLKVDEVPDELQFETKKSHLVRITFAGNSDADEVWLRQRGLAINDISVPTSGKIIAVKPAGKTIAFIGDSITAGCWVKKRIPSSGYAAEQNYAAQTARKLNAQDIRIAYSAAGLLRYGTGGVPAAPRFVKYIDFETKAPQYKPDQVIINIGTNDRRFDGNLVQEQFLNFFNEIHQLFPNAALNALIPFNQSFATELQELATRFPKLFFLIETRDWPITYTDGVHPDLHGSEVIAQRLTQVLIQHYGKPYFTV
ncbi:SGNH/GDSL hydrolase family protein [Pediococcus ethanolidurans]|uniref:SGNH/GDSL hydrolase family protein n=1 Tax=Pediococcus ethanolidurans TaxID=319653 RepID=UPI0021E8E060|nr:SGNH/GDSL hydrolase family protein [Pediococcus ethanolidurans]MCV3320918.1 SGNH/GDSL hydrolase family protein [Pediococcus ethanolidurans]MCV3323635.1 SGNH/GDSL hydrolase family protein [Pediococcus ethanolidurans]MCV3554471.1 SGNH/GDSL hydrolase family protein [Pediococcus ethanolidurans]